MEYRIQGSGKPFLYVSGVEGTGKLFYRQAEDLARDHTVITFPLRGAGRYAMRELVEDVRWIVRDAGFERVTVLGESFGGLLAMATALEHPSLFERMILVNTFPFFRQRAKIRLGVMLFSVLPVALMKAHRTSGARRLLFSADVSDEDRRLFREHTCRRWSWLEQPTVCSIVSEPGGCSSSGCRERASSCSKAQATRRCSQAACACAIGWKSLRILSDRIETKGNDPTATRV
jgi:pimeloyl-ACP methyl ester carboxylesterase